jgi:hypothetical protein
MTYKILALLALFAFGAGNVLAQDDATDDTATESDAPADDAAADAPADDAAADAPADDAADDGAKDDAADGDKKAGQSGAGASKSVAFCLSQCTPDTCKTSQGVFQGCMDKCHGRFEGVIKGCKIAGKKAGFKDAKLNEDAKFTPCPAKPEDAIKPLSSVTPPVSADKDDAAPDAEGSADEKTDDAAAPADETAGDAAETPDDAADKEGDAA